MPMLNSRLELHTPQCRPPCRCGPIHDTERLCRDALNKALAHTNTDLPPHHYEDALAELVAAAWRIAGDYDPSKDKALDRGQRPNLAAYVSYILKLRVVDAAQRSRGRTRWQFAGHTYERELPQLLSLDAPLHGNDDRLDPPAPDHSESDPLAFTVRTRTGDPAAHCDPALANILRTGPRDEVRHLHLPRPHTHDRAA